MTVLLVNIVLLQLIGTVNFDGEHGLDAGTVSGRERSLIGSGYGCQIQIIVLGSRITNHACRVCIRNTLGCFLVCARNKGSKSSNCQNHQILFHNFPCLLYIGCLLAEHAALNLQKHIKVSVMMKNDLKINTKVTQRSR